MKRIFLKIKSSFCEVTIYTTIHTFERQKISLLTCCKKRIQHVYIHPTSLKWLSVMYIETAIRGMREPPTRPFAFIKKKPRLPRSRIAHLPQISTRDIALMWESGGIAAASRRRVDPEAHKLIRKASCPTFSISAARDTNRLHRTRN